MVFPYTCAASHTIHADDLMRDIINQWSMGLPVFISHKRDSKSFVEMPLLKTQTLDQLLSLATGVVSSLCLGALCI